MRFRTWDLAWVWDLGFLRVFSHSLTSRAGALALSCSFLQNGMLGGYYVIRNVKKPLPGSSTLALFERHKSVNVE